MNGREGCAVPMVSGDQNSGTGTGTDWLAVSRMNAEKIREKRARDEAAAKPIQSRLLQLGKYSRGRSEMRLLPSQYSLGSYS